MEIALVVIYVLLSGWTVYEIAHVRVTQLTFADGHLFAVVFYIMLPIGFWLYLGEIIFYDLPAPTFSAYRDMDTTANLYVGWAFILLFHFLCRFRRRTIGPNQVFEIGARFDMHNLWLLAAMYLVGTIAVFALSGKASGGHWMENLDASFKESSLTIVVANFTNILRTVIFGFVLFCAIFDRLSPTRASVLGAFFALFDVALTFNRIALMYYAIMICIIYRRYLFFIVLGLIIAAPTISFLSNVWTMFRGLVLNDGLTIQGIVYAFVTASHAMMTQAAGISKTLNGIFEASNITVFNYLVKAVPTDFPLLYGETFVIRPLTVLVPSTIWPNKPDVFGIIVGQRIMGFAGVALNSTLFGAAYGNFYYFWPFALIAYLTLLQWIYSLFARVGYFYNYFGLFIAIALWRFDMSVATIAIVFISCFEITRRFVRWQMGRHPMFQAQS